MITLPWPPSVPGVYRIDDRGSGRFYVGSSTDIDRRWRQHRERMRKGSHPNPMLQAIWNKNPERLTISVLLVCQSDKAALLSAEQAFLNASGVGSNRLCMNVLTVAGSHMGRKRSPETRAALSRAHTGKKASPEAKARMRAAKLGRKLTPEHRRKIGEKSLGRPGPVHSPDMLAKWRRYTPDQVTDLRAFVAAGSPVLTAAKACGMSRAAARRILSGESYANV